MFDYCTDETNQPDWCALTEISPKNSKSQSETTGLTGRKYFSFDELVCATASYQRPVLNLNSYVFIHHNFGTKIVGKTS